MSDCETTLTAANIRYLLTLLALDKNDEGGAQRDYRRAVEGHKAQRPHDDKGAEQDGLYDKGEI